jgi:hypothetical protein
MSLKLQDLWFSACSADRADIDGFDVALAIRMEIEAISIEASDQQVGVELTLLFAIFRQSDEEVMCEATATFEIAYAQQNAVYPGHYMVTGYTLRDVWPVWRHWLLQTLVVMNIPAPGIPVTLPGYLIRVGAEMLGRSSGR